MNSKRCASIWLDDALEQRINARRIVGSRIRSFSAVACELLNMALDATEREQQSSPPAQASNDIERPTVAA